MEYIFQATEVLLKTYDMAKNIEILVMGNEPEWENALIPILVMDGEDYRAFLNEFANRLTRSNRLMDGHLIFMPEH